MEKFTNDDVLHMLESNPIDLYQDVVTGRLWTSEEYSDIDTHIKRDISREAFRYVAEESTKGTIPATLVATNLRFYLEEDGYIMPIGSETWMDEQSFTDNNGNMIHADLSDLDNITFRSVDGSKTIIRPTTVHHDYIHICLDIPRMYDDPRNDWKIK